MRIPVDDMVDLVDVEKDEVPGNPYRVQKVVEVENTALDDVVEADVVTEPEFEAVVDDEFETEAEAFAEADVTGLETVGKTAVTNAESVVETDIDVMDESVESGLQNDDIREYGETVRLPSDKADYMRMSVAEKVRCYPFDDKGTDAAFEMVRTYFEKIGMDTSFDSVYEETKLLTDYYEKLKAEEFIQKQTEQIIEKMDMMGIDTEKFSEYPVDVLSKVFDFGDMEYFAGIKIFNQILDKLGVNMAHQDRYELFDRIYQERKREKKRVNSRTLR